MKTLKFTPELVARILRGEKTSTWRLFDDKDLQVGDEITCLHQKTGQPFGTATITSCNIKTLGTLTESDWVGHERYSSDAEMYATYRSYYGDQVGPDSEMKLLEFTFVPLTAYEG